MCCVQNTSHPHASPLSIGSNRGFTFVLNDSSHRLELRFPEGKERCDAVRVLFVNEVDRLAEKPRELGTLPLEHLRQIRQSSRVPTGIHEASIGEVRERLRRTREKESN